MVLRKTVCVWPGDGHAGLP